MHFTAILFFFRKGEGKKKAKQRMASEKICGVSKVLAVSKIRSKFTTYEQKRALCGSYDLFLADNRILPLLPKLLGKTFFKKKKHPVPVELRGKNWRGPIEDAIHATHLHLGGGSCFTVRLARTSHSQEQVLENFTQVLDRVADVLPGKWKNIQSIYIKTKDSVALPVHVASPNPPDASQDLKQDD